MRLIKNVTRDTLPYHENLTIRCELGQEEELKDFMDRINPIDLSKDYEIIIRPKGEEKEDTGRCEKLQDERNKQQDIPDESEKKPRRRSRNANAYYRQLTTKIASKLGVTETEYHNTNLAKLGIAWLDENGQYDWILRKDNADWKHFEERHYCPSKQTEVCNGTIYRWFYRLKSTKDFNKDEMSKLIELAVHDAKKVGIETLTPAEIEKIKAAGYA